jgi:Fe-Mn family superoxide dismutase
LRLNGDSKPGTPSTKRAFDLVVPSRYVRAAARPAAIPSDQFRRPETMAFTLPPLPYAYDDLMPYMSAETLQFHHDKHHQAYVDMANKLVPGTKYEGKSIEEICKEAYANKDQPIINNVGQDFNHIHFWKWMKKGGGGKKLPGKVEKLVAYAGGFDKVRNDFIENGKTQFGSGWTWLAIKDGKLVLVKTPNGENPLMHGAKPILGCDVWEHSYYIDYRNARPKYLEAWFDNLVNWDHVEEMIG